MIKEILTLTLKEKGGRKTFNFRKRILRMKRWGSFGFTESVGMKEFFFFSFFSQPKYNEKEKGSTMTNF